MTVIVPTYQGAPHLEACLESVAAQALDGVEVLVVDDGSTDGTVEIARSYGDRIEHLRVVENEERLGAVANVNRCLELAQGRWVKPVFQDDLLDPECLTTMRAARRRRVPVVVCARRYLYEEGVPDFRREGCEYLVSNSLCRERGSGLLDRADVARVIVRQASEGWAQVNLVGEPVAVMFDRRAALRAGGFDAQYVQLWDYELVLRLAVRRGMVLVDETLATFRVHQDSETARNFASESYRVNVLDRLRLHVAYATGWAYRAARSTGFRHDPPADLWAVAHGVAAAARVLRDGLPPADREQATVLVDSFALPLADAPPEGSEQATVAATTRDALVEELLTGPWLGLSDVELRLPATGTSDDGMADAPPTRTSAEPTSDAAHEPSAEEPATPASTSPSTADTGGRLRALRRVATALRTNQWWGHMLGPIVAFAALQLGWRSVAPGVGLARVVALLASAIALAGYAYVTNDTADVEPDRRVGKPNAMARFSPPVRLVVIAAFAAVGAVPWIWVPLEAPAMVALAGIYLIPVLYSVPPVRLKERHLLGPIADASNAFVVPALFTIALFAPLGAASGPDALMVVGAIAWGAGFGLRAIVIHQVDDLGNDRISGTRTLVGRIGRNRAIHLQRRVLFPLELVGLGLLAATVATWSRSTVVVSLLAAGAIHLLAWRGVVNPSWFVGTVEQGWFMYWYQLWPALIVSVALVATDPWYLLLVALVLLLFWPRLRSALHVGRQVVEEVQRRRATTVT